MSTIGTVLLLRLRRDRLQLLIWALAFLALMLMTASALGNEYGSAATREAVVRLATHDTSLLVLRGAPHGTTLGALIAFEIMSFAGILAAIMNTMLAVRHVRAEEEQGRVELVGATRAGRIVPTVATLLEGVIANIIIGAASAVGLMVTGLEPGGSSVFGLAVAACGFAYLGIGLVCAQLFSAGRTANAWGIVLACLGWMLRGIGDATGTPAADGLSATSGWASWVSPIGWAQQVKPFAGNDLRPALLALATGVVLAVVALWLQGIRDIGAGFVPARRGRPSASAALAGPIGLAWRQQRGVLIAWAVGAILLAVLAAELVPTAVDAIRGAPGFEQIAQGLVPGGHGGFVDLFIAGLASFVGLVLTGGALQAIMRLRQDEASGLAEAVLGGRVGRLRWLASTLVVALGTVVVAALLAGLLAGATGATLSGEDQFGKWFGACLAQLPAVFAYAGVLALVFALVPRATIGLGWALFGLGAFIGQFGGLMKLPEVVRNLSPSSHTPAIPTDDIDWSGAWWMLVVCLVALVAAAIVFRRRDLQGR
jgi:ABC-2 type transport system permease protein